jgi:hypothetical protein
MGDPVAGNIFKSNAVIWVAPAGTAFPDPDDIAAGADWGGAWDRVGFTAAPVAVAYDHTESEFTVEEMLASVARMTTGEGVKVETTLAELTATYLQLGLEGTVVTTAAASGVAGVEDLVVGNAARRTVRAYGIEGQYADASGNILPLRFFLYRATCHINAALEFSKHDDKYTGIPIQILGLGDPDNNGRLYAFQRVTAPELP